MMSHENGAVSTGDDIYASWPRIFRLVCLVVLIALVVCLLSAGLVRSIFGLNAWLFSSAGNAPRLAGELLILGSLLLAALIHVALVTRGGWRITSENSFAVASSNFHAASGDKADPSLRYARSDFGLAYRKFVATILTIGSGGAGGVVAPMVVIAEAIGAGIARLAGVKSLAELQTCQLAAIAAAAGAIFRTPFSGALFAAEIMYRDRVEYQKLSFCLLAAIIAAGISQTAFPGGSIDLISNVPARIPLTDYLIATLVAIFVSGPVALVFASIFSNTPQLVARIDYRIRIIVSALLCGAVAIALWEFFGIAPEQILGAGQATLERLFNGDLSTTEFVWVLGAILIGRMITVTLTVGGNGSVGLFAPAAFFGGASGAIVAGLLNWWAVFGHLDTRLFVIVGIASAIVVIVRVPLTAIALTIEVFGPAYGPPAALACAITYVMSRRMPFFHYRPKEVA